jgi:hypothetical protein
MGNDHPARAMFRVSPAAYVDERSRLARAAKSTGDKDLGKQLQALRRPTLAMWAVVAAADDPADVRELVGVTDELAVVQGRGDREATVEMTKRRRAAIEAIVGTAVEALRPWEPSAEARRAEIRTIVDQLSRHLELASAWIDGTLRELPETDAFGFAAFNGMETPETSGSRPKVKPARRLTSVPPLAPDADAAPERAVAELHRARERAEREARAARAVAAREARRDVEAAAKALAAVQRKVTDAETVVREAEAALRAFEADRDIATRLHVEALSRLADVTADR